MEETREILLGKGSRNHIQQCFSNCAMHANHPTPVKRQIIIEQVPGEI
jgi:hypothetical protein